ncbi:MAG: LysM peptidoglycan-binding domain-containing protein [Bacteroidales bacterium]|jgi:membrane-bound lytic murein transglycosylase D|nr:LysM peptidoglycan-binding domain-containing protein [Bacteroidales bacterium]
MNKTFTLLLLSIALSTPLAAQMELELPIEETDTLMIGKQPRRQGGLFNLRRNGRKQIEQENEVLRDELDSLQLLLDSLRGLVYVDEDDLATLERLEGEAFEYTTETSDSLLHLWYENSLATDFDAVNEYNMDSVRFSSNVTDAEMMRRLSAMNSFITLPYNDVVKNYIILYSERMTSRMGQVLGLSAYYFPIFEDILLRYDLPQELKYMAIIESMLNPVATSSAGARGIWQFMYQTGRSYGLEINSFVDERLDVEKAVDAAARYLRDAYKIFGDWALAISSYNCGAGNVSKAIRRANGKRDFWSIYTYLPKETRGYVPAFVGAMYAMTYYREYGIVPQNMGMPAQTDTFEIRKNLHFGQISGVVGVPMETLQNLNPQYVHDIIPGNDHPYILKLPFNWTGPFLEANRDSLYAFKADSLLSSKILQDQASGSGKSSGKSGGSTQQQRISYKVKSGDYLGKIASRYGVTINQIKNWNNLRSNNIQIGQTLYIYKNGGPSISQGSGSSSSSGSSKKTTNSKTVIYTVKSGDSLYKIAKLYPGVSADNIKTANGLKSDAIRAGQKLTIPIP